MSRRIETIASIVLFVAGIFVFTRLEGWIQPLLESRPNSNVTETAVFSPALVTASPTMMPYAVLPVDTPEVTAMPANDVPIPTESGPMLAPAFTLRTLDGRVVSLSDYREQRVLINFWATWCGPCRIEMPAIQRVYDRHKDEGFTVLAIDFEEPVDVVQPFIDELALTFPILLDEQGKVMKLYNVLGLPTSFFIDVEGRVVHQQLGAMVEGQIERILQQMVEME